ncbi:BREX-1 system adenine-specific DNA-methyltransferase PglX, partial [Lactiplantibacillus pentosus]|nr:BREX-1 system adenine-specific DNA-methyltransferase PglX [Lactiplantibacillus pentosus]
VEIIGWLYQYYNTEPHDYAVNITGGPVTKSEIPAATQLFTTDWVVRYMVDNSLGKYWLERHPNSQLRQSLEYLLPGEIKTIESNEKLEDMRFIDNAMGSGHILVYAFDVFMKMYAEAGYSSRDAALSIVQNNLYGLEIDKRAFQLAYFALMMKARQYNRRALQAGKLKLNVHVFEDTNMVSDEFLNSLTGDYADDVKEVIGLFENARELGSIIRFEKAYDWSKLRQAVESIQSDALDVFGVNQSKKLVLRVLTIAEILTTKYDIAVTNPPYLNKFDADMKKYVKKHYADYSGDLFSIFIFNNINLVKTGGYAGYMTPFVWMFIKTYEKLRNYLVTNKSISSLIQMEYSAFEEATVPINTFVLKNEPVEGDGTYIKLSDFKGGMNVQRDKVLEAIGDPDCNYLYRTNQANFGKIPGSPIAYWASSQVVEAFENTLLRDVAIPRLGMATADNKKFLRLWFEVSIAKVGFNMASRSQASNSTKTWFPYDKGGNFRKWYGNNEYVVNWKNDGYAIKNFTDSTGKVRSHNYNQDYIFTSGITWNALTSGKFSSRVDNAGFLFDNSASKMFLYSAENIYPLQALLSSPVTESLLRYQNPTLNFQPGTLAQMPVMFAKKDFLTNKCIENISLAKNDWDSFENSWDFKVLPLLAHIADD